MRQGVGVKIMVMKKILASLSIQWFAGVFVFDTLAILTLFGFRRFLPLTRFLKSNTIRLSAQSNLENYIYLGFQNAAVATLINPY
jgi:hypothetical protein